MNNQQIEGFFTNKEIHTKFITIENSGGGNCLFYSMSQILNKSIKKHREIRKKIYDYYQQFDMNKSYENDSIESKIQMLLLLEGEEPDNEKKHHHQIINDGIWGNSMDILVLSKLFNVNIIIFSKFNKYNYMSIPIYHNYPQSIYLKYTATRLNYEHYEMLILRYNSIYPNQITTTEQTKTSADTKLSYADVLQNNRNKKIVLIK